MNTTAVDPQGWVGCLGCYNAGNLNGKWVSADEAEDIPDVCPRCGSDEFDVFDTDNLPHPGGYYSVPAFVADARALEDADEPAALAAWAGYLGQPIADAADDFEDHYCGTWDSFHAYADDYIESTGILADVDEYVAQYFDVAAFARDRAYDYTTADAAGSGVYVFKV